MYNVNYSGGLGAMEQIEQGLWDSVPGDSYKDGKFIVEALTAEGGEGIEFIDKASPPMSKEAAEAMVADLTASLAAKRAGLAARGIGVPEATVKYACDDLVCGVQWSYAAPARTWMSRQQFTTQSEAEAHMNATLQMLQADGWEVLNSRVTDLDTPGYWRVVHTVDMTPLYLQLEEPGEGETIAPPVITEEKETVIIPTTAAMTRGQKIGLGVGLGLGVAVLVGGVITAVVISRRGEGEAMGPEMGGYGRYRRSMGGYGRVMRGSYRKPSK